VAKKSTKKPKVEKAPVLDTPRFDLVVVDGNNVAYKFVGPPFSGFTTKTGRPSGIFYGMLKYMKSLNDKHARPGGGQFIYCWDGPGSSSFRKSLFPAYKSDRDHSGEGHITDQLTAFKALLGYYGYESLSGKAEADDIAFTVVSRYRQENPGRTILLVSEDHDWEQMVKPGTGLWKPRSKSLLVGEMAYSFEVYHTLRGDPTDHIGVSGVCDDVRALELAAIYPTVEDLLKGEVSMKTHADALRLRSKLVRLYDCDWVRYEDVRRLPDPQSIVRVLVDWDISKPEQYLV
jgi:5'-3' exonuclease